MNCQYSNCKLLACFYCLSCKTQTFFCPDHYLEHWKSTNHSFHQMSQSYSQELRQILIRKNIKQAKKQILYETEKIIKEIQGISKSAIQSLKDQNRKLKNILDFKGVHINKMIISDVRFKIKYAFTDTNELFLCNICGKFKKFLDKNNSINIGCGHYSCGEECFKSFVKNSQLEWTNICCPTCNSFINPEKIASLFKYPEAVESPTTKTLSSIIGDLNIKISGVFRCSKCDFFDIINQFDSFKCPSCKTEVCPLCRSSSHPSINCELNMISVKAKILKEKSMLESGSKHCPHCEAICTKYNNYNFITCTSPICKGLKYFCFLCGKSLDKNQRSSHYKKSGTFGDTCNSLDGTKD